MKINIFIDMDGVLAVYDKDTALKMYDKGFFLRRPPHKGNIKLAKELIKQPLFNVYVLSSLLADSVYIAPEKDQWLDRYLPEVSKSHRLFVPEGVSKRDYVLEHVPDTEANILLDDYTVNLEQWTDDRFTALKVLNGQNNTKKTWVSKNPELVINYRAKTEQKLEKIEKVVSTIKN